MFTCLAPFGCFRFFVLSKSVTFDKYPRGHISVCVSVCVCYEGGKMRIPQSVLIMVVHERAMLFTRGVLFSERNIRVVTV